MFRPSGGLLYHWRAWRSRAQWVEFTRELELFLCEWTTPSGSLVLIGPSGGYTLPVSWLRGFSRVHAYDVDPLAPFFFGLNHRGVPVEFHNQDIFWRAEKLSTAGVEACVRAHPGAAFLFCNVLGQLPLENALDEDDFARYLRQMRASLDGERWASYHDLFTVEPYATERFPRAVETFRSGRDLKTLPGATQVIDHMLGGEWSQGLHRTRLGWPLSTRSLHLIEAVHP